MDEKNCEKFMPAWSNRVGKYRMMNMKGLPAFSEFELAVTKDNILLLITSEILVTQKRRKFLLQPLSDNLVRKVGVGADGGSIIEAREDETLFAFGYHFRKL